ncbi:MAG: CDGSH iron-sulfur domain-containing protein [Yoonia sp.]|uniref:CDGSH iron-sulfur domain-containing protein n=1 Tax=Yoonia sp. TaxID=2212373 RepID=UPI00273F20A0|nr:CDGSH iron-sulfur domain-containing protein [Yoonia sp.]MDP5085200.1 CDGSH iron-sulfur domain-containing protein [Yoonia sp.]
MTAAQSFWLSSKCAFVLSLASCAQAGPLPCSLVTPTCSLCRCGLSKNKPFCDGSHLAAKWSDDGTGTPD